MNNSDGITTSYYPDVPEAVNANSPNRTNTPNRTIYTNGRPPVWTSPNRAPSVAGSQAASNYSGLGPTVYAPTVPPSSMASASRSNPYPYQYQAFPPEPVLYPSPGVTPNQELQGRVIYTEYRVLPNWPAYDGGWDGMEMYQMPPTQQVQPEAKSQKQEKEAFSTQEFASYWEGTVKQHQKRHKVKKLPEIFINLKDASATVKAPQAAEKVPKFYTPITNICRKAGGKGGKQWTPILTDLNGHMNPGEMTLVVGGPGSGKTVLLKMIGGRLFSRSSDMGSDKLRRGWKVEGLTYNGKVASRKEKRILSEISLVAEEDVHIPQMTVKETLKFAFECKHGDIEDKHLDMILQALGLAHVADTKVGNEFIRGVSGGERRRVSVGEMWHLNSRVLLADRLTDGLDSKSTIDILEAFRAWCKVTGANVILSLNQPPPEAFGYFDQVIVMDNGKFGAVGDPHDEAMDTTLKEKYGYTSFAHAMPVKDLETHYDKYNVEPNPASIGRPPHAPPMTTTYRTIHLNPVQQELAMNGMDIDMISGYTPYNTPFEVNGNGDGTAYSNGAYDLPSNVTSHGNPHTSAYNPTWANSYHQVPIPSADTQVETSSQARKEEKYKNSGYGRSWFAHFKLCLVRQFFLEHKNVGLMAGRILLNLFTGLLTGSLWANTTNNQAGLFLRTSFIYHTCVSVVASVVSHIGLLFDQRPIVHKQLDGKFYHSSAYWCAFNFFQIFFWGFVETLLFTAPAYWQAGLQKSFSHYALFWMGTYLLNIASSLFYKFVAIVSKTNTMALALSGLVQLFLFLSSGFLVPWVDLPSGIRWARYLSPQSFVFEAVMINEFRDTAYVCTAEELQESNGVCPYTSGNQWLARYYINNPHNPWLSLAFVCGFVIGYFILGAIAYHFVRFRKKVIHITQAKENPEAEFYPTIKPITLTWSNLSYTVKDKKNKLRGKKLLNDLSGYAKPGTITALMGPSGAGKSTLLDVLAGRKTKGKIEGEINLNGYKKEDKVFPRISGYVEQTDSNTKLMRVIECLDFAVEIRNEKGKFTWEEQRKFVSTALVAFDLWHIRGERIEDVSIDVKKRVSVAVELMGCPSILFLDEPTTGLDGHGAHLVMTATKKIAAMLGIAVVCTIHQPSTEVFELFDQVYLMHRGGEIAYFGPLGEHSKDLVKYMSQVPGVEPLPFGHNPANWMLEQMGAGTARDESLPEKFRTHFTASSQYQSLRQEIQQLASQKVGEQVTFKSRYPLSAWGQLRKLTFRAEKTYVRMTSYNLLRLILTLVFAAIIGSCYFLLEANQAAIFLRFSLVYVAPFYVGATFLIASLAVLLGERNVFYRETTSGMYYPWVYGLAYQIAELPYLAVLGFAFCAIVWVMTQPFHDVIGDGVVLRYAGFYLSFFIFIVMNTYLGHAIAAVSPNLETGNAIGPGMASWMSSFAGFYLPRTDIPGGYIWIYWLNPFRYTFEGLNIVLFRDANFVCTSDELVGGVCPVTTGDQALKSIGLETSWLWFWLDFGVVFLYTLAFMVAEYLALQFLRFTSR